VALCSLRPRCPALPDPLLCINHLSAALLPPCPPLQIPQQYLNGCVRIADYGTADGGTSMPLLGEVIQALKGCAQAGGWALQRTPAVKAPQPTLRRTRHHQALPRMEQHTHAVWACSPCSSDC